MNQDNKFETSLRIFGGSEEQIREKRIGGKRRGTNDLYDSM